MNPNARQCQNFDGTYERSQLDERRIAALENEQEIADAWSLKRDAGQLIYISQRKTS
jgi:hypothetical protein